jgi:chromate reductase
VVSVLARVVVRPKVVIAGVMQKITDGKLADESSIKLWLEVIDDLFKEIRLLARTDGMT